MKHVTLPQFLTEAQIERAYEIYKQNQDSPAEAICKEVIEPIIATIDKKLGQENNAMYLAYACEFVFNQIKKQ